MNSWSSYRKILTSLIICFIVTSIAGLSFTMINFTAEPYPLHVRIINVEWPISPSHIIQKETRVTYDVFMIVEVWNPSKKTMEYTTANENLLDPQAEIVFEGNYSYIAGYLFWIHITTHEIHPGNMILGAIVSIQINGYNDTIPPSGEYTFWSGIYGEPELYGDPPFGFKSYETVIHQVDNESTIEYEHTPRNWGSTYLPIWNLVSIPVWSLSGIELTAIVYLIVRNYRKNNRKKAIVDLQ